MKSNEAIVLQWMGVSEGGYVDHPKDPGGATNFGVTQRAFDAWRKSRGRTAGSVSYLTKAEANAIFVSEYLAPVRFNDLPSGLDYAMADYSVNSGPGRAARALQGILGVAQDGVIGAQTLAALAGRDVPALIVALCQERIAFMRRARHPKTKALLWPTFGKGWERRVMGNAPGVQTSDIGVIDRAVKLATMPDQVQHIGKPVEVAQGKAPDTPVSGWAAFFAALVRLLGGK